MLKPLQMARRGRYLFIASLAFVVLAVALPCRAEAQEEIVLDFTPLPQRAVVSTTRTESVQVVDIKGDAKLIDGYKAQGIKMPMRLTSSDFSVIRSRSGKRDDSGNLPIQVEILKASSQVTDAHGKAQTRRSDLSDYLGTRLDTMVRPGGMFVYIPVKGHKSAPDEARVLSHTMSGTLKTLEVLNGARMRIGETRQQKTGFEIPIPGMGTVRIDGLITYRLAAITADVASIHFDSVYEAAPGSGDARIVASGGGQGSLEFNLQTSLLHSWNASTSLSIHIEAPGRVIGAGVRMKQHFNQAIEEVSVSAKN